MTKALLYCRMSSDEQPTSGTTLDAQERTLVAAAIERGFEFEVVREDGGLGDSVGSRDRLAEALDLLDEHKAHVLMAVRLDRLSGTPEDASSLVRRSQRRGWGIILAGEPLKNAAVSSQLLAHAEVSEARQERGLRTREGMQHKKREGATFGRRVDRSFLAVYRRVIGMAQDGFSMNAIARTLNEEGVATAKGSTWHASTVRAILTSETAKDLA